MTALLEQERSQFGPGGNWIIIVFVRGEFFLLHIFSCYFHLPTLLKMKIETMGMCYLLIGYYVEQMH